MSPLLLITLPLRSAAKSFEFDDTATWNEAFTWLIERALVFKKVFAKKGANLTPMDASSSGSGR